VPPSRRRSPSTLRSWLSRHRRTVAGAFAAAIVIAAAVVWLLADGDSSEEVASGVPASRGAPAPRVLVREVPAAPREPADLGFPTFATKNTTRVAGANPVADAAGVALAAYPASGGVPGPDAVTLVDVEQWQAAIASASLVAAPVGAPVLFTDSGELPALTEDAIAALGPKGSGATAGRAAFVIGEAAAPDDLADLDVSGSGPAELAARIDRLRKRLAGKPEHVLIASSDEPAFAMPAAGWGARSGDPVLFVRRGRVPAPTAKALDAYPDVPVYALGPESAISARTLKRLGELASGDVERVAAGDPVASSVRFARYASGSFGWNINDPGHGFVIASADRPLDAAAAAPLSASGTWGPLLVTDRADEPPPDLRRYLLDLKPGYESDPTRAVYNHLWLIGDRSAISVGFQARVDELAEVAPVSSGTGPSR
jgi:hypothetical protein